MAIDTDVTFKDEGKFVKIYFNTSKAIEAANVRFPKVLEIIDDMFSVVIFNKSILPMKLWCKENELSIFEF